jgi:hypothetical protein
LFYSAKPLHGNMSLWAEAVWPLLSPIETHETAGGVVVANGRLITAVVFPGLRPGLTETALQAERQGVVLRVSTPEYLATPMPFFA